MKLVSPYTGGTVDAAPEAAELLKVCGFKPAKVQTEKAEEKPKPKRKK